MRVIFSTPTWVISGVNSFTLNLMHGLQRVGHEVELGYFLLSDIACARGGLGLPVERDLFFQPKPLSEVKAQHERA